MNWGVRKNRAFVAAGCAAALSVWSGRAAAQAYPGQAFPTQGTPSAGIGSELVGRLSGAQATRHIEFDVVEQAHYDSDVARGSSVVAGQRGLRQDDYIYQPSAKASLTLPVGPELVYLDGSAGYDFYQYNKVLERERIDMLAGLTAGLGPCQGSLQGAYNRHQSDLVDLASTVTKNTVQETSIGVQASCSTGAGIGETLGYQHGQSSNTGGSGVVDADANAVSAGLTYSNRAIGQVGLNATYSKVDYGNNNSATSTFVLPAGFETYSAQLSFVRPIGRRLVGEAEVGYSKAKAVGLPVVVGATQSGSGFTGITGIGALSYNATSRLQLTLRYQRSVTPTLQDGSNFAIDQNIALEGHYQFTPRLKALLGGRWGQRSFKGQLAPTPNFVTDDRQQAYYGSIQMAVGRHASLALDVRRDTRNTNLTLFNYNAYRVGVTATQTF